LAKKAYTILIFSQKAAKVKKFILSPLTLKIGAVVLGLVIIFSGFVIHDYLNNKKKITELQSLRAETHSQQEEIRGFMEKIFLLEEELNKLKEMEKQVEKDLQEVKDLQKARKVSPRPPKKKISNVPKQKIKEVASIRREEISILEKERSQLVSRLHQDLLELRREAFQREQNLKEFQEFLQAQKSILLATPCLWPVLGRITSGFGDTRLSYASGGTRPHKGIDISAPSGTPVVAAADGVVTFAGRESEYGRLVCIDHGHGFLTMYGHLKELNVQAGDKVGKGQVIGTVGLSGNSTGPHLHYEVRIHGNPVNPSRYLNQTT